MQKMDCRSFKEMLDSYLCQELAVETNHAMLHHAEHCSSCRCELGARRQLRESLRRSCAQECMSEEALARLRARLRAECLAECGEGTASWTVRWREVVKQLWAPKVLWPFAVTAALLVVGLGAWRWLLQPTSGGQTLSPALFDAATEDHLSCGVKHLNAFLAAGPAAINPESLGKYDLACARLPQVVAPDVAGLHLCAAHVCNAQERQFAHLVYTKDAQVVSLLVTARDAKALGLPEVLPADADNSPQLELNRRQDIQLGAYQTAKRVVIVVSALPAPEAKMLNERLALPVAEYLRRSESQTASVMIAPLWWGDFPMTPGGGAVR